MSRLRAGILLPVSAERLGHFAIITPCETSGWVSADLVEKHRAAIADPDGLDSATIVLDPGHGGPQPGAVGPSGLTEAELNLDVVRRLVDRFSASRSIDPRTGHIVPGDTYAPPRVFVTHSGHVAGLRFRTAIANALRAHVFVSLHHNAEPDGQRTEPGSETYYQIASPASKRLAGLTYEEVFRALRPHDIPWVGDQDAGAKYRPGQEGDDYYGVLRHTEVPATLVEAAFISNPAEEALLRQPEIRDGLADALYRALARYFTTSDPGSGFSDPYPRGSGPSGALPSTCTDPA